MSENQISASSPPQVEGGPASVQEAMAPSLESLAGEVARLESVVVALVAFLIVGERPREAARKHIEEWFEATKGPYYE